MQRLTRLIPALVFLASCGSATLLDRISPEDGRDWLCLVPGRSWVYSMEMDGQPGPLIITNHLVLTSLFADSPHVVLSNSSWVNRQDPQTSAWYRTPRGWRQHCDLLLALPASVSGVSAQPARLDLPLLEMPWVAGTSIRSEGVQLIEGFPLPPENIPVPLEGIVSASSSIEATDIVMDAGGKRHEECIVVRIISEMRLVTAAASGPWTRGDSIMYSREELLLWLAPDTGIIRFEMLRDGRDFWNRYSRTSARGELFN